MYAALQHQILLNLLRIDKERVRERKRKTETETVTVKETERERGKNFKEVKKG